MDDELETERLWLRRWRPDDLERLVALYSDPLVVRYINREGGPLPHQVSVDTFESFVRQWEELGFGPWAVVEKASGRWIGELGLNELPDWPGPDRIEVGWELDPSVWGRGLATEGGRAAVGYGFEVVGLERIISVTVPANAASRRVMDKCGLSYQGEQEYRHTTVVWYAVDRGDWPTNRS